MITQISLKEFDMGCFMLETRKNKIAEVRKQLGIKRNSVTAIAIYVYDNSFMWFTDSENPHDLDSLYTIYWAWR